MLEDVDPLDRRLFLSLGDLLIEFYLALVIAADFFIKHPQRIVYKTENNTGPKSISPLSFSDSAPMISWCWIWKAFGGGR